jgi:ADP-heptose:LPS heptosyltransferase
MAVVTNDAIGNFVVATPLMQMLRGRFPGGGLDYFGGPGVQELAEASDLVDRAFQVSPSSDSPPQLRAAEAYHLVVNVERLDWAKQATAALAGEVGWICGPSVDGEGQSDLPFPNDDRGTLWADPNWVSEDIKRRFPFLETSFIGEIFCRLAYLHGPVPGYRVPSELPGQDVPDVLISITASLPQKLWPVAHWVRLVGDLRDRGLTVGLVGARPDLQVKLWQGGDSEEKVLEAGVEDLRGRFTLPQVVGAIQQARQVVTLDNGILHLACATDTPVVGLFRNGIHRLWAPPAENLVVMEPGSGRQVNEISYESVMERLSEDRLPGL